jgi:hypothetical protein
MYHRLLLKSLGIKGNPVDEPREVIEVGKETGNIPSLPSTGNEKWNTPELATALLSNEVVAWELLSSETGSLPVTKILAV